MGIVELVVCLMILIILATAFMAGSRALMRKLIETEAVQSEESDQYENVENKTEPETGEQVLEQSPSQEYIETVGTDEPDIVPTHHFLDGAGMTIAASVVGAALVAALVFGLLYKWQQKKELKKQRVESHKETENIEYCRDDTVEKHLLAIEEYLDGRMSGEDKGKFKTVLDTAKMFDAMFPAGGASQGRVGSCYLPALIEVSEKIANAPSLPIATSLMPFFHRTCDVLREAMEGELDAYQKAVSMDVAAKTKAVEQMAAAHHDTDDALPMQLQFET